MEKEITLPHKLTLQDRTHLTMTGVSEVVSFDDGAVILRTNLGNLMVQGRELKLKPLLPEGGQVSILGKISALTYEEPRKPGGFWRRLFG